MRLKIVYSDLLDDEVVITINKDNAQLDDIKKYIEKLNRVNLKFYQKDLEVFINITDVLFFETEFDRISAHTKNDVYIVKEKLYELENLLPNYFKRVSKSTIINQNQVYAINRSVTQPGIVIFNDTHKRTYISRFYFKKLKEELK